MVFFMLGVIPVRKVLRRYWPAFAIIVAVTTIVVVGQVAERFSQAESYPSTNYSSIEDGLCLGGMLSEPPPGTRAVLNVCETEDPYHAECHRWDPIPDAAPAPSLDWLRKQVEFVDEQRRAGRPVYVHCRAGVSRSTMVVTAYLMWRDGKSRDEALAIIRSKRSRIKPNPAFMKLLQEWEESLRRPVKVRTILREGTRWG
jgi:hypothetical protein